MKEASELWHSLLNLIESGPTSAADCGLSQYQGGGSAGSSVLMMHAAMVAGRRAARVEGWRAAWAEGLWADGQRTLPLCPQPNCFF